MPSKKVEFKLDQDIVFIDCYIPYDFTKNMGQLAVEIKYTNGKTQMLTTASTLPNSYGTHEFDNDEAYFDFIKYLKSEGIPKGKEN